LIAFEGLDQSGKETQARLLRARLEQAGHRVESLTFPDDTTTLGQEIRAGLGGTRSYPPDVMQLLYIANRHERKEAIEGWLASGVVVICDRYLASSADHPARHRARDGACAQGGRARQIRKRSRSAGARARQLSRARETPAELGDV
jgi:thymidylate kinase